MSAGKGPSFLRPTGAMLAGCGGCRQEAPELEGLGSGYCKSPAEVLNLKVALGIGEREQADVSRVGMGCFSRRADDKN